MFDANFIVNALAWANRHNLSVLASDTSDAVVILIITNEQCPKLLFTKRSRHLKHHAGEMGLVGGKKDDTDSDIMYTTYRESFEEIALKPDELVIVGELDVQISKLGVTVKPLVGLIEPSVIATLVASADEIDAMYWIDLCLFCCQPTLQNFQAYYQGRYWPIQTMGWRYDNEIIWGLSARIVMDLVLILKQFGNIVQPQTTALLHSN